MGHQRTNILRYSPKSPIRDKMTSDIASVSEEEILKINEEETLKTQRKQQKVGVLMFDD